MPKELLGGYLQEALRGTATLQRWSTMASKALRCPFLPHLQKDAQYAVAGVTELASQCPFLAGSSNPSGKAYEVLAARERGQAKQPTSHVVAGMSDRGDARANEYDY